MNRINRTVWAGATRLLRRLITPLRHGGMWGYDAEFGLFSEYFFRELFVHERKRVERSDTLLFVLTLDLHRLFDALGPHAIAPRLSRWLTQAARESDITGWLRERHTAAIIYTEVRMSSRDPILRKNREILSAEFGDLFKSLAISCATFPEYREGRPSRPHPGQAILPVTKPGGPFSLFAKRLVDALGSGTLLLVLAPLLLAIAAAIKCTSKGPVFFVQKRVGEGGRLFRLVKFRTMVHGADEAIHRRYVTDLIRNGKAAEGHAVYKLQNDPRVTPLGRLLRKTSLDELPQLYNVLRGEMSLVGPRPALPYETENYRPWHFRRISGTKPGITGVWQVEGRSRTTFDAMVRMDLNYIRKWSLLLDFKLLVKTVAAMYRGGY